MKILYTRSDVDTYNPKFRHIFLAGPSPRSPLTKSWRPDAINILKDLNFNGVIFNPEYSNPERLLNPLSDEDYKKQVQWEHDALQKSVVVFWVPRSAELPGFTTNIEFGWLVPHHNRDVFYGRPDGAIHTAYLDCFYNKHRPGSSIYSDLTHLLRKAIQ